MKKVVALVLLGILLVTFTGCQVKPANEQTDAEKFAKEYNIDKDNPFKYATAEEAIKFLEEGTGIILFGFPECPWCQSAVKVFNDALDAKNIKEVLYLNIKQIRADNTEEYQRLVELLKDNLFEDDENNKKLYVPDMYFVKEGKILGHNNDLSIMSGDPEEYLTAEKKEALKQEYIKLIVKVYSNSCNDCN